MGSRPPGYVLGGYEAGLAVARSLGAAGIPVVQVWSDPAEHARFSRHVMHAVKAPPPHVEPAAYVELLSSLAATLGPGVVFATTDESVAAVAAGREELASRHIVPNHESEVSERFLDKHITYKLADRVGVPAPITRLPRQEADLESCARDVSFPCLIKPRSSHEYTRAFGTKMVRVDDLTELREAWRQAEEAGVSTLVQELIPGPESGGVNYNAYVVDGQPAAELTARKVRLAPRDFGYPSAVLSALVPEVVDAGRAILNAMELGGFSNVEFKRDARSGEYKLMEINGRPNMSGRLSIRCGVNFPMITYEHLVSGHLPSPRAADTGVYWINEMTDPPMGPARVRNRETSFAEWMKPYYSRHVFATFSAADPRPFLVRTGRKLAASLSGQSKGSAEPRASRFRE